MTFNNLNNLNSLGSLGSDGGGTTFNPITLSPLLWVKDAGVTKNGSNQVSAWADQSGNGNNLATIAGTPTWNASGLNSLPTITFDGVSAFMKATAFTLIQPEHVFIMFRQLAWSQYKHPYDGNTVNSMTLTQNTGGAASSPMLATYAGNFGTTITTFPVNTFGVIESLFNLTNSFNRVNGGAAIPVTKNDDIGTRNAGGFTVAAPGDGSSFCNVEVGEIIVYPSALSDANAALVNSYLKTRWGL